MFQNGEDETRVSGIHLLLMLSAIAMLAYAQQTDWIDGSQLVLQTLDKVTARIQTVDAVIGEPVRFGTLGHSALPCFLPAGCRSTILPFLKLRTLRECWQVRITKRHDPKQHKRYRL